MLKLEIDKRVKGELETIWNILTDVKMYSETAPDIVRVEQLSGSGLDMVRQLHHKSGRIWEEECKAWEPLSHFTMQIKTESYPLPVSYLRRTLSLEQKQKNVVIKASYEYNANYGPFGFFLDKHQIRPVLEIFSTQLLDNFAKKIHKYNVDASTTAATILKCKSSEILTITPDTLISDACKILTDKRIGCVIALNAEGKISGILSERDIVNGVTNHGGSILDKPATEFMTHDVIVSQPEDSMAKLMSLMISKRIRHLPVIDDKEQLAGVISIGDIINARMTELEQESDAMQQYIEGRKWREVAMQIGRSAASEEFS